jgi:hypothetical protein
MELTDNLSDWYPPGSNDSASGNDLFAINEIIQGYLLEVRRLGQELGQDLEQSRKEAEGREDALVAKARERARNERQMRDHQIIAAHAARVRQLGARLQPALPFSPDSDQPTTTSLIPELSGRRDSRARLGVAAEEPCFSESHGISEQPQQQIPIDPSLSLSVTAPERIARHGLVPGTTLSDTPATVVAQVTPPFAASASDETRTGSSAFSSPAHAASSPGAVQTATTSPSSASDPKRERVTYRCKCGVPAIEGEFLCEDCRLWHGKIAR